MMRIIENIQVYIFKWQIARLPTSLSGSLALQLAPHADSAWACMLNTGKDRYIACIPQYRRVPARSILPLLGDMKI